MWWAGVAVELVAVCTIDVVILYVPDTSTYTHDMHIRVEAKREREREIGRRRIWYDASTNDKKRIIH